MLREAQTLVVTGFENFQHLFCDIMTEMVFPRPFFQSCLFCSSYQNLSFASGSKAYRKYIQRLGESLIDVMILNHVNVNSTHSRNRASI